jgi:AP-1 complex subunit gamma-1
VQESDIVDLLDTTRTSIYVTPVISEYLLNALIKLTTRFQQPTQVHRVRTILTQNTSNLNVEIQQRAVEYENLFQFDDIRRGVVERMPAPEIRENNTVLGEPAPLKKGKTARKAPTVKKSAQQDLLDILGGGEEEEKIDGGLGPGPGRREQAKNAELLKDLFGAGPTATTNGGGQPSPAKSNVSDIMDLFGQQNIVTSPPPAIAVGGGSTTAFDDLFGRTSAPTPPPQSATQSYRTPLHVEDLC